MKQNHALQATQQIQSNSYGEGLRWKAEFVCCEIEGERERNKERVKMRAKVIFAERTSFPIYQPCRSSEYLGGVFQMQSD